MEKGRIQAVLGHVAWLLGTRSPDRMARALRGKFGISEICQPLHFPLFSFSNSCGPLKIFHEPLLVGLDGVKAFCWL